MSLNIELIIGTYEEFLLGYKIETTKKVRHIFQEDQFRAFLKL